MRDHTSDTNDLGPFLIRYAAPMRRNLFSAGFLPSSPPSANRIPPVGQQTNVL